MENLKKIGIKTIIILILSVLLIITFILGQKNNVNDNSVEFNRINQENIKITKLNDSLLKVNIKLDEQISINNKKLEENDIAIYNSQIQINKLNKRKNEISNNIDNMSAINIASGLSDYLQTKSSSTNK